MLDSIVERVREDLPERVARFAAVQAEVAGLSGRPPALASALQQTGLSVIAEVKRRSPSRGSIDEQLDPVAQARRYAAGGAHAISVLTERHHFSGDPLDLQKVASAFSGPVLRKDFIVHPVQVWEARAWGAAAVLLIVAVLDDQDLRALRLQAEELGMDALVEVHDEDEVERAVASGASVIGVNNRDLSTFDVDLQTAERLRRHIPEGTVTVAESGIWTAADADRMRQAGYDAVLVGEALVRAPDPSALIRAFACG